MRLTPILAAMATLLLLAAAPATADVVAYPDDGFSADFVHAPKRDTLPTSPADGMTMQNLYDATPPTFAGVFIARYNGPFIVSVPDMLTVNRDTFTKGLAANPADSRFGEIDGQQALFFNFVDEQGRNGAGIIVAVPGDKPLLYIVVTIWAPGAAPETVDAMQHFRDSFHLLK